MKKILMILMALVLTVCLAAPAFAVSDSVNGDWASTSVILRNTNEAELMVRVGDIDAINTAGIIESGYDPFTARNQRSHSYPWTETDSDPLGTDRVYIGSNWKGGQCDGYSGYVNTAGPLSITMTYDASGITVRNALLQLCIDDFQALDYGTEFSVSLNGRDAPFVAELLNHVSQGGPTSYIITAIIPSGFLKDVTSGRLTITIDEVTGKGDGYCVDFAKLLINAKNSVFTGTFSGWTEPGAPLRLLGTSTTVTTGDDGVFFFDATPGLNAVRVSKPGYVVNYDYGIVLSEDTEWNPGITIWEGESTPDIDFSRFAATNAWANASEWAEPELQKAEELDLIPEVLREQDLTKPISRLEFAAVSVRVFENLSGTKALPDLTNPFTDTNDIEVLKAYNVGITDGTSPSTFTPDARLSREQCATMLTRVFKRCTMTGWTLANDSRFPLTYAAPPRFADDAQISDYARDSVYFMTANRIIEGVGNNLFAPRNTTTAQEAQGYANATREQALAIAVRMVENLN